RLIKESKHAGIHASSMPVQINVFVYLKELAPPQGSTGGTTQRRATKRRIENTMERMNQDPDFQGLGPGWKRYMATAMARKGAGDDPMDTTPLPVIPDGTTYRQLGHIDDQHQRLAEQTRDELAERDQLYRKLPVKIAGLNIEIEVNVRTLRRVLRLPPDINLDGLGAINELGTTNSSLTDAILAMGE
ncbi:hypothetical protein CPC16_004227, partial [Podila verticillata]